MAYLHLIPGMILLISLWWGSIPCQYSGILLCQGWSAPQSNQPSSHSTEPGGRIFCEAGSITYVVSFEAKPVRKYRIPFYCDIGADQLVTLLSLSEIKLLVSNLAVVEPSIENRIYLIPSSNSGNKCFAACAVTKISCGPTVGSFRVYGPPSNPRLNITLLSLTCHGVDHQIQVSVSLIPNFTQDHARIHITGFQKFTESICGGKMEIREIFSNPIIVGTPSSKGVTCEFVLRVFNTETFPGGMPIVWISPVVFAMALLVCLLFIMCQICSVGYDDNEENI